MVMTIKDFIKSLKVNTPVLIEEEGYMYDNDTNDYFFKTTTIFNGNSEELKLNKNMKNRTITRISFSNNKFIYVVVEKE